MPSLKKAEFDRRVALKLLASAMAAAMARCSPPNEEIIPYTDMPEGLVAGEPSRFATTLSLSGYGRGFLGISVDGRPIKIEGNPRHPFSLGATDAFSEAEVLSLYDPDRSSVVRRKGAIATWDDFTAAWNAAAIPRSGAGLGLVTGRVVSPTTRARVQALKARFPELRWYRYEPVNDDSARDGARLAFSRMVTPLPRWRDADVIVSLDADPLGHGPDQLRIARDYSSRRRDTKRQRLFAAEPVWTLTGAAADIRLPLKPELIREVARAIANALGANAGAPQLPDDARLYAERAARELAAAQGRALVLTGEAQPPELHALCHWINTRLQAPVDYFPSQDTVEDDHGASLTSLADDLHARRLSALIVADTNPVYDSPDSLRIGAAIEAVPFSAHLGLYRDETAQRCTWHLPLSHALESWGDACAPDGTASLVQPLIQRLYDTRTRDELLAFLADEPVMKGYDTVRAIWRARVNEEFEGWWRGALHDGVIGSSAAAPVRVALPRIPDLPRTDTKSLALVLSPGMAVWDGRFANNAWLQECPQAFTKEVWGNAVQLAPEDAARLGIEDQDTVDIHIDGQIVSGPAIIMQAQAPGVIGASWGYGRARAGRIGTGIGARYSGLGPHPFLRVQNGAQLRKSAKTIPFRSTQGITRLNGRAEDLFPIVTAMAAAGARTVADEAPASLLPIPPRGDYAWAMVVDTDSCIGCNACVVACQAENNVPVVGPDEIVQGRDMHWLRIDAYARVDADVTRRGFQPIPCMHCELAPCEPVCPVAASVHDHEGLNVQVYNRCIGTRFCEANCPYKVRRFNWFAYAGEQAYGGLQPALKAQHNPDVSVRGRGVMEKCNYCLQRIARARSTAEKENRTVAEGEMVTACQAACPTRAIDFGDLNRTDSQVSQLRGTARHYALLAELNTRPRTTYLRRVYNDEDKPL